MTADPAPAEPGALFRLIAEHANDIILSVDDQGIIDFLSPSARMLTAHPERFIGRDFNDLEDFIHPDDLAATTRVVAESLERLEPCRFEYRHRVHETDDTYVHLEVSCTPVIEDGVARGFVTVSRDITKRKALEDQVLRAQKLDALGVLAAGIVHDLNNLLTPITAYVDLSLSQAEADTPLHRNLSRIQDATARASALTRKILAFSRHQMLEVAPARLADIVGDFAPVLHGIVPDNVTIDYALDGGAAQAAVDVQQVQQVIVNLVANACDAVADGGRIGIATNVVEIDEATPVAISGQPLGTYARLTITDDGVGFDTDTLSRAFEPFFTTKRVGEGVGLGLSAVYGIVEQHRGNLRIDSEPGQGTTVKVYFPLVDESVHTDTDQWWTPDVTGGTETLALVDDEAMIVEMLADALAEQGYGVIAATGPYECLELINAHGRPVDLLITDVVMPGLTGPELHERVIDTHPNAAVLYMSGYTDSVVIRHGVEADEAHFLQKPFTLPQLLSKVRDVLTTS